MKKIKLILAGLCVAAILTGCGDSQQQSGTVGEKDSLAIAYQYGLSYAPVCIVQDQELIEKAYKNLTGKELEVTWTQMSSGSDINAGISAGSLQVGMMGISPAITGIQNGIEYRIFASIAGQPHGMMTNLEDVHTLGDYIGREDQIAVVNLGSFQHILLAKALWENGYDPHALDSNIAVMKNPDGMTAIMNGTVSGHVTSNQYILGEREEKSLHELTELAATWSAQKTHTVGVAAISLKENNPKLYEALCQAFAEADDFINKDVQAAADICAKYDGMDASVEAEYMKEGTYSVDTAGLMEIAEFMYEAEFIENCPESYSDLVFDNVKGN